MHAALGITFRFLQEARGQFTIVGNHYTVGIRQRYDTLRIGNRNGS